MTMTTAPVLQASCSICTHAQDAECEGGQRPIADVLADIVSGRWAAEVDQIRVTFDLAGKDGVDSFKKSLPGAIFAGTFSHRKAAALKARSGVLCVDLDHSDNPEALADPSCIADVKQLVSESPHVAAAFVSPTGTGLKVLVHIDTARTHRECFDAVERYFAAYGLKIDPACKDVSRLCFVSHDANAYVAEKTAALDCSPASTETTYTLPAAELSPADDYDLRGDFPDLLRKHGWKQHGASGRYWTRPGKSSGVSASWGCVPGRFYVFTSNAAPLEAGHLYRPWHVFAHLEHGGDFSKAVGALRRNGFGADRPKPLSSPGSTLPPATEGTEPQPAGTPAMSEDEKILAMLAARAFDQAKPPPPTVPVYLLAGICVCTRGNLTAVTAQAKAGKTAFLGAFLAAGMWHPDSGEADTLGVSGSNSEGKAVLHFDTEQSRDDFWHVVDRAKKRALAPAVPDWLHAYSVADLPVAKARRSITLAMEKHAAEHGGIHSVFLDGVADFVADVNDAEECNGFVAELHALAIRFDCPIICVIHLNPNGEKERGHLGSQLVRKAESNLKLEKDGEVTVVWSEKQRRAPIFKDKGPRFRWSEEAMMHASVDSDSVRAARESAKADTLRDIADEAFGTEKRFKFSALCEAICKAKGCTMPTAERRVREMKTHNVVCRVAGGFYERTPRPGGVDGS